MTEVPTGLRRISVLQLSYLFLKHLFELLFATNQRCQVLGTYLHRVPLMISFIILAEICTVAISSPSECHPVFGAMAVPPETLGAQSPSLRGPRPSLGEFVTVDAPSVPWRWLAVFGF